MPLSKYFGGKGSKVMSSVKKTYGEEKGKSVFYALVNGRKGREIGKRKTK